MKLKFKYFIRGLGTGILFTAIIMSISLQASRSKIIKDNALTREQIIEKAGSYGMVMKDADVSIVDNNTVDTNEDSSQRELDDVVKEDTPEEENVDTNESTATDTKQEQDDTKTGDDQDTKDNDQKSGDTAGTDTETSKDTSIVTIDYKNIEITSGMNAYEVAELLYEQGLVDKIRDYQDYLVDNEYQRYIITGTYLIPVNADYSEITRIITKNSSN